MAETPTTSTISAGPRNWPPKKSTTWTWGTSGGVWGLDRGYCMMIGGEPAHRETSGPDFRDACSWYRDYFAHPGTRQARRYIRGRLSPLWPQWRRTLRQDDPQWDRVRHHGCLRGGHGRAKGGQYRKGPPTRRMPRQRPLRRPENYQFDLNLADISEVWRRGSVISSLVAGPDSQCLGHRSTAHQVFGPCVPIPARGGGTIKAAIDEGVPVPVLTAALYERFTSRGEGRLPGQASIRDAVWFWRPSGKRSRARSERYRLEDQRSRRGSLPEKTTDWVQIPPAPLLKRGCHPCPRKNGSSLPGWDAGSS